MKPFPALRLALLLSCSSVAGAGERAALILGNNAYPGRAKLDNCVNDATAVRDLLRDQLGFAESKMVFATDQNRIGLYSKLEEFKKKAAGADIALVYYAGHGMESLDGRETFLIPTDADLAGAVESESILRGTAIKLSELLDDVGKTTSGAKVILLDCCRDRPKARSAKGEAVVGGGLANLPDDQIPADTFIVLAAAPNRQASDGEGHGPFTQALLDILPKGGQSMFDAFFAVSDRVQAVTRRDQIPWLKFDGSGAKFRSEALVIGGGVTKEDPNLAAMQEALAKAKREKAEAEAKPSSTGAATMTRPPVTSVPASPNTGGGFSSTPRSFTNTLGMEFVPVPGTDVWFCIHETRVQDFRAFVEGEKSFQYNSEGKAPLTLDSDGWRFREGGGFGWDNPGFEQTDAHPVTCVSWNEAHAFLKWLSQKEGKRYRLPTDHEWSVAVGIGSREDSSASPSDKKQKIEDHYPWGGDFSVSKINGNYCGAEFRIGNEKNDSVMIEGYRDDFPRTAPVKSFVKNPLGLYDMGGNVWEFCEDLYDEKKFVGDMSKYVLRGGSYFTAKEEDLRSSNRFLTNPATRYGDQGFRVVMEVIPGDKAP